MAAYFEEVASRSELNDVLLKLYDSSKIKPANAHRYLAEVSKSTPILIVTTSYDTLMEQALDEVAVPYDVVVNGNDKRIYGSVQLLRHGQTEPEPVPSKKLSIDLEKRTVIYKLYGSVDRVNVERSSFFITDTDFMQLLERLFSHSLIPDVFLEPLHNRSLLFMGLGLRDWVQRAILNSFVGEPGLRRRFWAIMLHPSPIDLFFWQRLYIEVFDLDINQFVQELQKQA